MTQAQLIDTWRSLFTERTSSPAIERFLGVLTDTPHSMAGGSGHDLSLRDHAIGRG